MITSFVTFHHICEIDRTLKELHRILRPNGYLIILEHNCFDKETFLSKYLHFIHAIMIIARVAEFAHLSNEEYKDNLSWAEEKQQILQYTKTIHYRSAEQWTEILKNFAFHFIASFSYQSNNPQQLFYAIYQKQ